MSTKYPWDGAKEEEIAVGQVRSEIWRVFVKGKIDGEAALVPDEHTAKFFAEAIKHQIRIAKVHELKATYEREADEIDARVKDGAA